MENIDKTLYFCFVFNTGDDLITPVYVPPTVVPPPSLVTEVPGACDDEETDCITGSGFGPTSSIDDTATTIKSIKIFNILIITVYHNVFFHQG